MPNQNILIIMADQLTPFAVGCYGNPVAHTPNIDRLAQTGTVFDAAYSSSPLCAPARYAFMSGRFVSRCGGYDNAAYLPATTPTFAHYLRLAGYRTTLCGKMHFIGADQLHGFEERLTTDIYPADFGWVPDWTRADERIDLWYHNMSSVKQAGVAAITNQLAYDDEVGARARAAIYDYARGDDARPMCLVVGFIHPHDPYAARKKYWDLYDGVAIPPPTVGRLGDAQDAHGKRLEKVIALDETPVSDDEIITARRAYFANVSYVDAQVGALCDVLDECEMADNTTVIFTADHGDMLGERGLWFKMSFMEWSCRIPLVIGGGYGDGNGGDGNPGRRVASPVSQVDMLPTLMSIAGDDKNITARFAETDPLSGRSLLPLCSGDDDAVAISEYLAEGTAEPMLMIRRGDYKFIACASDADLLFDLKTDPNELRNLAADDAYINVMQQFHAAAKAHWNPTKIKREVIASQKRRRAVHAALATGRRQSWDYNPPRNAAEEFTRSHHDLTDFDTDSRYPRPPYRQPVPPGNGAGNSPPTELHDIIS